MPQSLLKIYVHLIWSTKYRSLVLIDQKRGLIFKKIKSIAIEKGYHLIIINGVADHVHCLIRLRHSDCICRLVNDLKGISSNWINKNKILPEYFDWQDGYAAFSVCPRNVKKIIKYIKNQELHHKLS